MTLFSQAARHLVRQETAIKNISRIGGFRAFSSIEQYEDYGRNVFSGKVADEYLEKYGKTSDILKDPTWVKNHADTVANAVFEW